MRGVSVKWPNWGSGFGSTALLICADFLRSVSSTPKLLEHALDLPDKSDFCVCPRGGPFLKQNRMRYSAFWSWCMVRIFLGNFDKFAIFWKSTLICIFVAKSSHFPLTTRILQANPCKMLFIGLNLEFLGAGFFDEERGSQTFQKHPSLVDRGYFFYKKCKAPQYLGGIPATQKSFFGENELLHFHAKSIIKWW